MIDLITSRASLCRSVNAVVVATTVDPSDDMLCEHLQRGRQTYFRGSVDDVLDRYYQCARSHSADVIVRVTADDPLKDPDIMERGVKILMEDSSLDYVSNTLRPTYPEGLDVEIFRISALEEAWSKAALASEREHVTPYIWKNSSLFNLMNFGYSKDLSHWRWTVDYESDVTFFNEMFQRLALSWNVNIEDLLAKLPPDDWYANAVAGVRRNQGYYSSITKETTGG